MKDMINGRFIVSSSMFTACCCLLNAGCQSEKYQPITFSQAKSRSIPFADYSPSKATQIGQFEITQVWADLSRGSEKLPYLIIEFDGPHIHDEPRLAPLVDGVAWYVGLFEKNSTSFFEVWQIDPILEDSICIQDQNQNTACFERAEPNLADARNQGTAQRLRTGSSEESVGSFRDQMIFSPTNPGGFGGLPWCGL